MPIFMIRNSTPASYQKCAKSMDMTYFRKAAGMKLTTPKKGNFEVSRVQSVMSRANRHGRFFFGGILVRTA